MTNKIITIGRQYGSGGREIGKKLADAMGVPFYDKALLSRAAQESGFCEEILEDYDEKPVNSLLYSLFMGGPGGVDSLPLNQKLFLAQFDAIKKVASEGPCVIIGRCADYALRDHPNCVNIFIHAQMEARVQRLMRLYNLTAEKAEQTALKRDKQRASYYNFYSDKRWGAADHYHLVVDSSAIGIDNAVELIRIFAEMKQTAKI